jgi:hypothetical protein
LVSCGGIAVDSGYGPDGEDPDGGDDADPDDPTEPTEPEPIPDCSGVFNEPVVAFEDPGWISQALTPAANGLEFFYARLAVDQTLDTSGKRLLSLRTRPTIDSDFGEAVILTELLSLCEDARMGTELAALDLSYDGLRLYVGCSTFIHAAGSTGPLLMLERKEIGAAFEPPAVVVGEVGISVGITRDELTAYGTSLDPSVAGVVWYKRKSVDDAFGPPEVAPGSVGLFNPEPAPDGLELWGAMNTPGVSTRQLAMSRWNDEMEIYEKPTNVVASPPPDHSDYSPALTSDCRTLYFARYSDDPFALSQVMKARR